MAEAQRAVDKNLRFDRGVPGDEFDLLQAQLPGQNGAGQSHLGGSLHACQVMQAHLGAGMEGNVRQSAAYGADKAQILHNQPVCPCGRGKPRIVHSGLHLPVVDQGVEGDVYLAAADMAVAHGLFKFLVCEVFRAPAGVEIAHAQVHGVGAVLHSSDYGLRRARGREQLYHSRTPHSYRIIYRLIIAHTSLLRQDKINVIICIP